MNGHAPGSEQLEPLRLRRRLERDLQNPSTSRSSSISTLSETTTSSNEQSQPTTNNPGSSYFHLPRGTLSKLFLIFLLLRSLNALLTTSFFQPDEYWQSLELAHKFVFRFGYATWEWTETSPKLAHNSFFQSLGKGPIRTFAYPSLFVPIYWILKLTRLDNTVMLTLAPRLLQAFFSAIGDLYTFRLSQRVLNEKAAYLTIIISYASLYTLYTSTRTFSNSLESVLTAIALYYWPLTLQEREIPGADPLRSTAPTDRLSLRYAFCAAACACIVRPTNIIIWAFLALALVRDLTVRVDCVSAAFEVCVQMIMIGKEGFGVLIGALLFTLGLDSIFYSQLTFTPISFLYSNVFKSISLFYGSHPFHWYLTQGIPVLTFTTFPFLLHGIYLVFFKSQVLGVSKRTARWFGSFGERDLTALKSLTKVSIFTIFVFSLIGHKEFRFLQPLVPIFNLLITYSLMDLSQRRGVDNDLDLRSRNQIIRSQIELEDSHRIMIWRGGETVLVHGRPPLLYSNFSSSLKDASNIVSSSNYSKWIKSLLLLQLPIAIYLCHFHGKGQVEVMKEVRNLWDGGELKSVGFLMPCHSTPWQSHVHRKELEVANGINGNGDDGLMWFLTCEPPRDGQSLSTYKDQSDFFYQDPILYLTSRFPSTVDSSFPPSPPIQRTSFKKLRSSVSKSEEYDLGWSHTWPSHIVLFGNLLQVTRQSSKDLKVGDLLEKKGYKIRKRLWNTFKHEDERRDGDVVVMEWGGVKGR